MKFENTSGNEIAQSLVARIQENKAYLGEIDGLIGDGDHGMNMNKGFTIFGERIKNRQIQFTDALDQLGSVLLTEIGGSMGPIYGSFFMGMAEAGEGIDEIDLQAFSRMIDNGLNCLWDVISAQPGDKTLIDVLVPARDSLHSSMESNDDFASALTKMKEASEQGKERTRDLMAMHGRSARLGERSRGVLDAGATSCNIILQSMADQILILLHE